MVYWKADNSAENNEAVFRSSLEHPNTFEKFHVSVKVEVAHKYITDINCVRPAHNNSIKVISNIQVTGNPVKSNLNRIEESSLKKDLVLHPNLRIMFWIDATSKSITSAGMGGASPEKIITIESNVLTWLVSMSVDQGNGRIYWIQTSGDLTSVMSPNWTEVTRGHQLGWQEDWETYEKLIFSEMT